MEPYNRSFAQTEARLADSSSWPAPWQNDDLSHIFFPKNMIIRGQSFILIKTPEMCPPLLSEQDLYCEMRKKSKRGLKISWDDSEALAHFCVASNIEIAKDKSIKNKWPR